MTFEEPHRISRLFAQYTGLWAVAGGWAIDLFLNRETRYHKDIEVITLRNEQDLLRTHLPDWTFQYVQSGSLCNWEKDSYLTLPVHEIYATSPDGSWQLEILLNECEDDTWVFRRNSEITCPEVQLIAISAQNIPILAPEIVLLYKAKIDESKDEADLVEAVRMMTPESINWLKSALERTHKKHRWLSILNQK